MDGMRHLQVWAYENVGNTAAEDHLFDIVGRMLDAERDACATIAEQATAEQTNTEWDGGFAAAKFQITRAIRARE